MHTCINPQAGFNTQFSWSFIQLAALHYQWPFPLTDLALAGALASRNATAIAEALSGLITTDSLKQAVAVPNLPSPLPPDYGPDYTGVAAVKGGNGLRAGKQPPQPGGQVVWPAAVTAS